MNTKAKVILLESKDGQLWSHKGRKLYYNQANFNDPEDEVRYDIYLITDEKIKEGNWVLTKDTKRPFKITSEEAVIKETSLGSKKIVATTDELEVERYYPEFTVDKSPWIKYKPKPTEEWIEYYVEEYNKGNIIEDVLVEYEEEYIEPVGIHSNRGYFKKQLKVNPDNTVNIKTTKEKYNVELQDWQIKILRNYFGENDNTQLSHWAFKVFDESLKQ